MWVSVFVFSVLHNMKEKVDQFTVGHERRIIEFLSFFLLLLESSASTAYNTMKPDQTISSFVRRILYGMYLHLLPFHIKGIIKIKATDYKKRRRIKKRIQISIFPVK